MKKLLSFGITLSAFFGGPAAFASNYYWCATDSGTDWAIELNTTDDGKALILRQVNGKNTHPQGDPTGYVATRLPDTILPGFAQFFGITKYFDGVNGSKYKTDVFVSDAILSGNSKGALQARIYDRHSSVQKPSWTFDFGCNSKDRLLASQADLDNAFVLAVAGGDG